MGWVAATYKFRKELPVAITIPMAGLGLAEECLQFVVLDGEQIPLPIEKLILRYGNHQLMVSLTNQCEENLNYCGLLDNNDKNKETILYKVSWDGKDFLIHNIEGSNVELVNKLKSKLRKLEKLVNNLIRDNDFKESEKQKINDESFNNNNFKLSTSAN